MSHKDRVKCIMYKGYQINVYPSDTNDSPDCDGDDNLFLVGYHRDFTVDRGQRELVTIFKESDFTTPGKNNGGRVYADGYGWKSLEEAKAQNLLNAQRRRGQYVPGITQELAVEIHELRRIGLKGKGHGDYSESAHEYVRDYHIFGLEAYIHSGVVLALSGEGNFCDRNWDVSQLGLVFASKKEWRLHKKARKAVEGLISYWNDYLSGNVYGFMIGVPDDQTDENECDDAPEDRNYMEEGGCWGFYGDYKTSGLLDEAKAEIDAMVADAEKEFAEQMENAKLTEVY